MATNLFKMLLCLMWAAVTLAAVAAPRAGMKNVYLHAEGTKTSAELAATCTNGVPASKQHPAGYPINDYTVVTPAANWTSYAVKKEWYDRHLISGPHVSSLCCLPCRAYGD